MDRVSQEELHAGRDVAARANAPSVAVSALTGEGIAGLLRKVDEILPFDPLSRVQFSFPIGEGASISLLHQLGRVIDIRYTDRCCEVEAEVPESLKQRLSAFVN